MLIDKTTTLTLQKAQDREAWPLTFAERQMATEQGMHPDSIAYNINCQALRFSGNFDFERFQKALNALVERHAILRSYYPMVNGEYEHRIRKTMHIEIPQEFCEPDQLQSMADRYNRPFDLAADPLVRCRLFEHGGGLYTVHFCMHHIIFDGACWRTFAEELFKLYVGEELPPISFDYMDFDSFICANEMSRTLSFINKKIFNYEINTEDLFYDWKKINYNMSCQNNTLVLKRAWENEYNEKVNYTILCEEK